MQWGTDCCLVVVSHFLFSQPFLVLPGTIDPDPLNLSCLCSLFARNRWFGQSALAWTVSLYFQDHWLGPTSGFIVFRSSGWRASSSSCWSISTSSLCWAPCTSFPLVSVSRRRVVFIFAFIPFIPFFIATGGSRLLFIWHFLVLFGIHSFFFPISFFFPFLCAFPYRQIPTASFTGTSRSWADLLRRPGRPDTPASIPTDWNCITSLQVRSRNSFWWITLKKSIRNWRSSRASRASFFVPKKAAGLCSQIR